MYPPPRRRRKKRNNFPALILLLTLVLVALIILAVTLTNSQPPEGPSDQSTPSTTHSNPTNPPTTTTPPTTVAPTTEPPVVKEASFTLSAMGDMLMHSPVFNSCRNSDGSYNFDSVFRYLTGYIQSADYAAGNLETTLAGSDFKHYNGNIGYSGYPQFNCPDEIIDGMKTAGFDMVLTANNHSYDTRSIGMSRTLEVIADRGLAHLGTKADAEEADYLIVERNGIMLALACYTYEDNADPNIKAPNGITMNSEDAALINTFNYSELDTFYSEISASMTEADLRGADAFVLFVHWGYEYQTLQASVQSEMAQELCDLGVDVIIGGHPHVVQPVELLTSTVNETQKTVCLYSMGNAVSNQRLGNLLSYINTAHTEDGVLFSLTFTRYSDGTVILESAECLPTWVNLGTNPSTGRWEYNILPLDKSITDWKTQFDLSDASLKKCNDSYDRTVAIVGPGMTAVNEYLAQNTAAVEALLGVK